MNKLTESAEATKTGRSLDAQHALILGGFGVLSGIIMIGASTGIGLVVSVFFGILALLLGWFFVTMVSPAVQMWVNRSIFGKPSEQEDMQILPFEDLASEQSSLEMVFQGVVVDLFWKPVLPNTTEYIKSGSEIDSEGLEEEVERASRLVVVSFKLKLPKLNKMDVNIQLYPSGKRQSLILSFSYCKEADEEFLDLRDDRGSLPGESGVEAPSFTLGDDLYETSGSG
ncbi:hypothetical protein [Salinicola aestuarinus]|uniref:hypothetical protein n=1 Tax=Salinicola aestuarinus TaxID=1949082 RepID=UPI00130020A1|nr:hypothetical protein [Salinicola aestuarinus]